MNKIQLRTTVLPALAATLLLWAAPIRAASFSFTVLDVPGQRLTNLGAGGSINDSDQVVGTTESATGVYQGFVWDEGTFTLFQTCDIMNSINANGLAVGYDSADFGEYCTVATKTGATLLYPVNKSGTFSLTGVNASGTVVAQNPHTNDKTGGLILVKRRSTAFAVMPEVKYGGTFPTGINDGGTIVGNYTPPMASWDQGFTYASGSYTMFNVPGAVGTYPFFITVDGVIGGEYLPSGSSQTEIGFILSGSTYTTISPPGAAQSYVVGIGPGGEVVGGWSETSGTSHGFIYTGGVYYQIDVPNAADTTISHVNALGSLVGTYVDSGGTSHPFIAQCAAGQTCTE